MLVSLYCLVGCWFGFGFVVDVTFVCDWILLCSWLFGDLRLVVLG